MSWAEVQPWWSGLAPVMTLIIGYAGTLFTESKRDERAKRAAEATSVAARKEANEDRRRSFEMEALQKAHEAQRALLRVTLELHKNATENGGNASDTAREDWAEATREFADAVCFVLDDEVRAQLNACKGACVTFANAISTTDGRARSGGLVEHRVAAIESANTAREVLSSRVRALYDESVTSP